MVICDTNIISAYLTKDKKTTDNLLRIGMNEIVITPIVFIELYRWLSLYKGLDKNQRDKYRKFFSSLKILYLNQEISDLAMEAVTKYDSIEPADILIGTTGVYYNVPVYTHNVKHFKMIKNITLYQEI